MHYCAECGQACYCHGDIDDCVVETEEYSYEHCTCCPEGCADDRLDDHWQPHWHGDRDSDKPDDRPKYAQ